VVSALGRRVVSVEVDLTQNEEPPSPERVREKTNRPKKQTVAHPKSVKWIPNKYRELRQDRVTSILKKIGAQKKQKSVWRKRGGFRR